ncbi:MAG TPA: metal ABC transporter permease, partial [Roseiflexaceae bacterium]|nr:metal ABC transporter permease [Roseiflexaceae bacterium]
VMAYLRGWNLFVGAIVAGLLTALGIGWLSRRDAVREDTAIGVLFTGMFAFGILLISTVRSFRDFTHILFGNILGVTPGDLVVIGLVSGLTLLVLALFHKEFELTSFDPIYAEGIGIRADRMRTVLLVLLAFTVVTSIQIVGVVLTSALLVTPAAAAGLLTQRLPRMMALGAVIAVLSTLVGLYTSYYAQVSSGAAIVLACTGFFAIAWLIHWARETHLLRRSL